jgi:hypothetical protein
MRSMIAAASLAALALAGCVAAGPAQPGPAWRCWIEDAGRPSQLEICERRPAPAFVQTCGAGDDGAPDACECGP